ncbi:hypothetical protein BHE74_00042016 [Ensete ventricosum]|nr:hypothetical protein BHE74_00042016 [Ensete ventricosum]
MLMYPEADIPVCQLSVQTNKDATYHYNMGKALASLRDEGVLIIGSGSATHNLRILNRESQHVEKWALDFDTWLTESLINGSAAFATKKAHNHFYPLHVALGAAAEQAKAELIHSSWSYTALIR